MRGSYMASGNYSFN